MKKARIKATIMAAVLCIATLGACGSKSIPRQDDYKQPTTEAKTTEKATDKVTEKETEKVTQKVTEKATAKVAKTNYGISDLDLAFLKAENTANNKAYSPLSIKYALNMLSYGASGNTKTQIEKVLGNNAVADYKTSENISIANSLFVRDSYKSGIKESYISSLQKDFKAELVYDSFENATNVNKWVSDKTYGIIDNLLPAIDKNTDFMLINALAIDMEWKYNFRPTSDSKTDAPVFARSARYEHINYGIGIDFNIIAPFKFNNASSEVSAMPIMASIDNYDIIKELGEDNIRKTVGDAYRAWMEEHKNDSAKEYFENNTVESTISSYLDYYIKDLKRDRETYSEIKSTDFMVYNDDNVVAFAKDLKEYNGTTLQYVSIMPTQLDLDEYIKKVDSKTINSIFDGLKDIKKENFKDGVITSIKGSIPKFNIDYELALTDDLKNLGITDVFNKSKADLSGLTSDKGAYIDGAIHKANIELTQDGIKAAAVTVLGGSGGGGDGFNYKFDVPVEYIDLTFDKPYMFFVRDKKTGAIWFTGTVYEPTKYSEDTSIKPY